MRAKRKREICRSPAQPRMITRKRVRKPLDILRTALVTEVQITSQMCHAE